MRSSGKSTGVEPEALDSDPGLATICSGASRINVCEPQVSDSGGELVQAPGSLLQMHSKCLS